MAFLLWITGLSGAGKTTIAKEVLFMIKRKYPNTVLFDGDDYREITGKQKGYSREERLNVGTEIAKICKFLIRQDINVVCSTISLFREIHDYNRNNIRDYFEVFVECNMDELLKRDKKGIYSNSLKGEMKNVVGVDIAYDKPRSSHLVVDNSAKGDLKRNVKIIVESFYNRENYE